MATDESSNEIEYVPVPVPREHVPKVIALLADLDRGLEVSSPTASEAENAGPRIYLDANLVARMYLESEARHRELLETLAANPGKWITTAELADILGVTSGSKGMAGMFGAFGRRAKHRYGGEKPWDMEWEPIRNEARYQMKPKVAAWISSAAERGGA
jgi:hypothetical protein